LVYPLSLLFVRSQLSQSLQLVAGYFQSLPLDTAVVTTCMIIGSCHTD